VKIVVYYMFFGNSYILMINDFIILQYVHMDSMVGCVNLNVWRIVHSALLLMDNVQVVIK